MSIRIFLRTLFLSQTVSGFTLLKSEFLQKSEMPLMEYNLVKKMAVFLSSDQPVRVLHLIAQHIMPLLGLYRPLWHKDLMPLAQCVSSPLFSAAPEAILCYPNSQLTYASMYCTPGAWHLFNARRVHKSIAGGEGDLEKWSLLSICFRRMPLESFV